MLWLPRSDGPGYPPLRQSLPRCACSMPGNARAFACCVRRDASGFPAAVINAQWARVGACVSGAAHFPVLQIPCLMAGCSCVRPCERRAVASGVLPPRRSFSFTIGNTGSLTGGAAEHQSGVEPPHSTVARNCKPLISFGSGWLDSSARFGLRAMTLMAVKITAVLQSGLDMRKRQNARSSLYQGHLPRKTLARLRVGFRKLRSNRRTNLLSIF